MRFEIHEEGADRCRLVFEHVGLTANLDCYETCNSAWSWYLNQSLRSYLETGDGKPYGNDS